MTIIDQNKDRETPVCTECKSDDILSDAYAQWDNMSQQWELASTFDKGSYCNQCGGECRIMWVPATT